MNLALIASLHHPIREPFAGGLEQHTHALATGLKRRGHRVTTFACDASDADLGHRPILRRDQAPVFSRAAMTDSSAMSDAFMTEHHAYLSLMMNLQRSGFDAVHNNSLHYLPVAMAAALPCPLMSTLHTPPTPWLESAYRFYGGGRDAVVSVSRSNARAWNLPGIEIGVIHNGVDLRRWAFSPEPPRGAPLVWFGRLVPEKAPHLAIDAALLRDEHITIIGPAHDAAYFDRELRHRFKNRRVDWVGPVNHDELTRLVGRSAVTLCTPAWDEPFGLVVIESLACGTPVAALDRGAMRELLDDTTGAIADRNDAEGLARAIEIARRKHRQDCRRAVVNRFTLEAMLDGYESAMLQLAGSTR